MGPTGQDFAISGEEKMRILRGKVSSSGAVLAGTGFSASRVSAGTYLIDFTPDFAAGSVPALTVSAEWTSGAAYVAMTNGVLSTATGVRIATGGGTLTDQSFYFIAVGPR